MYQCDEPVSGLVVRAEGGFYTVVTPSGRLLCTLVKRLRRGERASTNPLAVGDRVMARGVGAEQGVIEHIEPRRNELARLAPGRDALKHVLVANVDMLFVVASLDDPPPSAARLDRYLLIAAQADIPVTIVASKADLGGATAHDRLFDAYRAVGFTIVRTSVATGEGIPIIREMLRGRVSALIGPSGVGKSTLLNAVQPGLRLRSGTVSERTGKGRHTTTVAELLALDGGGYVADTPGLRGIEPYELEPDDLALLFPELESFIGRCRFALCAHIHEPGCAVRAAVDAGSIAASRYQSYVKLYDQARRRAKEPWARKA